MKSVRAALRRAAAAVRRPTLVRRVVGALLIAFGLVWAVLVGQSYVEFKSGMASNSGLLAVARGIGATLQALEPAEAGQAQRFVADADVLLNRLRRDSGVLPGTLLFQLFDAQGRPLYPPALPAARHLGGDPQRLSETTLEGTRYWVVRHDTAHWSLRLAEPALGDATVLGWIGRELLVSLLIAFPIVLLVLWLAVRRGLKPLRELAARVAARGSGELAPLGLAPRHAELQPLAAALEDLLAQLRQRVQHERAFVQDAAHELRTPMAVIATQAHLVAHAADAAQRAQAGTALEAAIARASHLSSQLLALAALDETHERARTPLDLAQLLRQLLAQRAPTALARGIELSLDAPERLERRLDTGALHSVLQNLLDNALRYGHEGGRIAVTLAAEAGRIVIDVADDGPGIAPAERDAVFERFQRGSAAGDVPGSGLGLAIVRQAVRRLGGSITLHDGLDGCGIRFAVEIADE